jgi:hypothetical protein
MYKDAEHVVVAGNYAYLVNYFNGLYIINVSDPAHPTQVGFYDTSGNAWGVAVVGNYAYVTVGSSGLRIINIANPAAPIEAGFYDTPGAAVDVAVVGNYAYVADGDSGLRIINVANPAAPTEAGFYDTPGSVSGVAVAGNYAYVTYATGGWDNGLRIINIANPADPAEVGFYVMQGFAGGVTVAGSYAYIANGDGGLVILRFVPSALQVMPSAVTFLAELGGANPPPRALSVESTGRALTWTATLSPTVAWLDVAPLTGVTPVTINTTAHISGLAASRYDTRLVIESEEAVEGSPQIIPITLVVAEEVHDVYLPLTLRNR